MEVARGLNGCVKKDRFEHLCHSEKPVFTMLLRLLRSIQASLNQHAVGSTLHGPP